MKENLKVWAIGIIAFAIILGFGFAAVADEYYFVLHWTGAQWNTNGVDIVLKLFSERDIINNVAVNSDITNRASIRQMALVWRPERGDTAIVWTTNGGFISDFLQMEYNFTEAANSNATKIVRQAFIFDEDHNNALGSVVMTEHRTYRVNTNIIEGPVTNVFMDKITGAFGYAIPETATVVMGTFVSGRRIRNTFDPIK